MRIITYVWELTLKVENDQNNGETTVFLASIYDKSEEENISEKEIKWLIEEINNTLDKGT